MTKPWGSEDQDREYFECDPERHDAVGWDEHPEARWPEVVNDRCVICGGPVALDEDECAACFIFEDTLARRRAEVA